MEVKIDADELCKLKHRLSMVNHDNSSLRRQVKCEFKELEEKLRQKEVCLANAQKYVEKSHNLIRDIWELTNFYLNDKP